MYDKEYFTREFGECLSVFCKADKSSTFRISFVVSAYKIMSNKEQLDFVKVFVMSDDVENALGINVNVNRNETITVEQFGDVINLSETIAYIYGYSPKAATYEVKQLTNLNTGKALHLAGVLFNEVAHRPTTNDDNKILKIYHQFKNDPFVKVNHRIKVSKYIRERSNATLKEAFFISKLFQEVKL